MSLAISIFSNIFWTAADTAGLRIYDGAFFYNGTISYEGA